METPLTENQKKAIIFLKERDDICDWVADDLTMEMSDNLLELCFMGYVNSYCETETWMLTSKGKQIN